MPKRPRVWRLALAKKEGAGRCRVCGRTEAQLWEANLRLECAHVVGRTHDYSRPLRPLGGTGWEPGVVHPDRVLPLCGPSTDTSTCHGGQHAHTLDLLPHLTLWEQLQAVADCKGIALAVRALAGPASRSGR